MRQPKPDPVTAVSGFTSVMSRRVALAATLLGLCLLTSSRALAEDKDSDDDDSLAEKAAARFPQPVRVGALLHRTVLQPLESQPILGHVRDVVRSSDGSIKVVVDYGGFLGFGAKPIAVPVDAMVLAGQYMEIVEFTPEELQGFPLFDKVGTSALKPDDVIRVGLAKPSH